MLDEMPTDQAPPPEPPPEDAAEAALETRLSQPLLKGHVGIEAAQVWVCVFLIVIAGALAYSNAVVIPFHALDRQVLVENKALHDFRTFPQALDRDAPRPAAMLALALNWWISPRKPSMFHAVNVAIHVLNGVLIFLLCRRLIGRTFREPVAMLPGLVFVLHPAATECVNTVVGRAGLLAAAFMLISLLLFLRSLPVPAEDRETPHHMGLLAGSLAAYLAAWACHESAVMLPVVVLAVDWTLWGRDGVRRRMPIHAAYWAMFVVFVVLPHFARNAAPVDLAALAKDTPPVQHVRAAALLRYAALTVWPARLTAYHATSDIGPEAMRTAGALVGLLTLAAVAMLWWQPLLGLALSWFGTALVAQTALNTPGAMFTEQNVYLPLVGATLVFPWLFTTVLRQGFLQKAGGIAAALLVLAAGAGASLRNMAWRDEAALWADAAAKDPRAAEPWRRLAAVYIERAEQAQRASTESTGQGQASNQQREQVVADLKTAEEHLRQALLRAPDDPKTNVLLGRVLQGLGQTDDALATLRDALERDPGNAECMLRIATLLQNRATATGDSRIWAEVADHYRRAQLLAPLSQAEMAHYAEALAQLGNFESAENTLVRAGADKQDSPLRPFLDNIRAARNQVHDLEMRQARLSREDPSSSALPELRATMYVLRSRWLEAAYYLEQAIQAAPSNLNVWVLMGYVKARMNAADGFLKQWPAPPTGETDKDPGYVQLARMCAVAGLWGTAQKYLESDAAAAAGISEPLTWMGRVALDIGAADRAAAFFREAAAAYPSAPGPWLGQCDVAILNADLQSVEQFLAEAESRGADPADIAERRKRASGGGRPASGIWSRDGEAQNP